ncbi:SDR family NAD(P)-dependent oxidoreductase [Parvibaculaceae bacterium PLY_AMNH_Bact1]|nr:SDR family NAD(P)-dependent oxidoreductase [Parvibaculaceae bacterium PLY_AMNH_Bact1]
MQDLAGKNAVITGGGDGIGRALALELAKAGANVAVTDIRRDAAEAVAAEAAAMGVKSVGLACDVTDDGATKEMAATAVAALGAMQIVWANAGLGIGQGFTTARRENLRWMYQVNVDGVIDTVRAFSDSLKEQSGFRAIGVTASMASLTHPDAGTPSYSASKYAVMGIAEGLRTELAPEGISVTVLCPGLVNTRIWDGARARPEKFGGPRHAPEEAGAHWRDAGMSVDQVGQWGVDALRDGQFFAVMPNDEDSREAVAARQSEILAGIRYPIR